MIDRELGEVWWEPISQILEGTSTDIQGGESWEELLEDKRDDRHYEDVVESIKEHGFKRPLTVAEQSDEYYQPYGYTFGDGHHRLAAAIDLGFTKVPVQLVDAQDTISEDSGWWGREDYIADCNEASAFLCLGGTQEEYNEAMYGYDRSILDISNLV